jgi:hypothetical protein
MEFDATELGSIRGGSARKRHIYRERDTGEWWFERDRYDTVEEAWEAVRDGFFKALSAAQLGKWDDIDRIPALLAKTLHLYFPDEILPICSHAHQMLAYCTALDLPLGYLVYASDPSVVSGDLTIRNSGREIRVRTVDLERKPDEVLAVVSALASEIASRPVPALSGSAEDD